MTTTLVPQMIQQAFQPLRDRLAEGGADRPCSPDEVRELLSAAALVAADLDQLREQLDRDLQFGVEGRKLKSLLKEFAEIIESASRDGYSRLRAEIAGSTLPVEERSAGLQLLDGYMARAASFQDKVTGLRRWLETARPQGVTVEMLKARGAGTYVDGRDILARLAAGGDI